MRNGCKNKNDKKVGDDRKRGGRDRDNRRKEDKKNEKLVKGVEKMYVKPEKGGQRNNGRNKGDRQIILT